MNYKKSKEILKVIEESRRILVNCHRNPDPDAVGSALALRSVLLAMGKDVEVVCPTSLEGVNLELLVGYKQIKIVDFSGFDFGKFDLLITLDSSSWDQVLRDNVDVPKIRTINIDHHKTNTRYGDINLVDDSVTSTAEMLYLIFNDWKIKLDKSLATSLMAGIVGDTGAFQFPRVGARTFRIATELMELGADKDEIVQVIYRSVDFKTLKFWGLVFDNAEIDKDNGIFWSAVSYEEYKGFNFGEGKIPKSSAATYAQMVKGTRFGFVAVEEQPQKLSISFRSRTGFDTSKIARRLGGGGHVYASGGKIVGLPFKKAVEKVLKVARKHAKKTNPKDK